MLDQVESRFWGRDRELAMFRDWNGQQSQLTVLYGRRRVGKTRLVEQACHDRDILQVEGLEGLGQTEQQAEIVFKVNERIVLNYLSAKRLAITLSQVIRRYEQQFGELELDVAKRRKDQQ